MMRSWGPGLPGIALVTFEEEKEKPSQQASSLRSTLLCYKPVRRHPTDARTLLVNSLASSEEKEISLLCK